MKQENVEKLKELLSEPSKLEVIKAFKDIHPAAAAEVVFAITEGIDGEDALTAQGAAHPDFRWWGLASAIRISNSRVEHIKRRLPEFDERVRLEEQKLEE